MKGSASRGRRLGEAAQAHAADRAIIPAVNPAVGRVNEAPVDTASLRLRLELAGHVHDPFQPALGRKLRLDLLCPQREGER